MSFLKSLKRWLILATTRLVALAALVFSFTEGIKCFVRDLHLYHLCQNDSGGCQRPPVNLNGPDGHPEPINPSIPGLMPGTTIPFHKTGFVFASLHWSFFLLACLFLLLIELPKMTRAQATMEALVSLLLPVRHTSIAPQGAAMLFLGLDLNSRSVPTETRVAGWMLFVTGGVYILFVCPEMLEHPLYFYRLQLLSYTLSFTSPSAILTLV